MKKGTDLKKTVQTYEYKVLKLASEIAVCATEPSSESLTKAMEKGRLLDL